MFLKLASHAHWLGCSPLGNGTLGLEGGKEHLWLQRLFLFIPTITLLPARELAENPHARALATLPAALSWLQPSLKAMENSGQSFE